MQFRSDVGNGAGLVLRRPGPPFSASILRGFPVDYGPRLEERRHAVQVPSRQQPNLTPKISQGGDDQDETHPSRHLWVGNVSQEVTEGLLVEKFSKYGPIESVTVYSQRNYAFINFRLLGSAQDAKNGLQGVVLGGLAMRIEFAKGAKPSRHLWVGGIGQTVSREQIEGEFKRFGLMEDFKFLRDRNCAFVDYEKIEDAIAAVGSLNRKRLGDEELRVDFGRSQPPKREPSVRQGNATSLEDWRGPLLRESRDHRPDQLRAPTEPHRGPQDVSRQSEIGSPDDCFRGPSDGFQAGLGTGTSAPTPGRSRGEKEEPSDVLWVGFPLLSKVDEEGLRRAFVPYGEVERVKTFPGRTYAFVQFKNVEEARRAKDAMEGKLFNDPRVHIRFSNSEIGPVDNPRTDGNLLSPSRGREVSGMAEKVSGRIVTSERFGSVIPPLRPTGLRPEYYPGGLARGAALARAVGTGGNIGLGRGLGRVLGSGGPNGRVPSDERDYQSGSHVANALPGAGVRPRGRFPYDEQWELPEEEIVAREPKRLRIIHGGGPDSTHNSSYGGRGFGEPDNFVSVPDSGRPEFGVPSLQNTGGGDEYNLGSGVSRAQRGSVLLDAPRHAAAVQGLAHSGTPPGPAGGFTGTGKREVFGTEAVATGINEGWKWHGTIAKGGTPVCRARCLPVGKGINVTVPDVVNCTARTDLDMLAKHVYQAGDFGVVFFVPEADPDVPPYHDFMHYLGEKHRAGVAKLADGTTLFLVPPSEFSERVLKVPGNNCLFGVVLKSQQPPVGHTQLQQQASGPQQHHLTQQLSQPPQQQLVSSQQEYSVSQSAIFVNGHQTQDNGMFRGLTPPQGQLSAPTAAGSTLTQSQLTSLAGGLPTVLTPELIASLTALLPQQNQIPALPSPPLPLLGPNNLPPPSREGRGAPSSGSMTSGPVAMDNRSAYRPPQSNQQSMLQSQGWPSVQLDQQSASGGRMSISPEQGSTYTLPPQGIQALHSFNVQHPFPGPPPGQTQQGYPGVQSQGFSEPGYGGQHSSHQSRSHNPPPHLGGDATLLPTDQLAQLTALLTQRQQQPAQQQQASQLLQQHYQQQLAPAVIQQHQQLNPTPSHQPIVQSYNQQLQPQLQQYAPQASSQQQWAQGGPLPQHASQPVGHLQMPSSGNSGGWDGGIGAQGQQHQHQRHPQPPGGTAHQPQIPLPQQQLQQAPPTGVVNAEQVGGTSQDDAERQKRFQATLQLAAALLQQMQHQQTPGQVTADQS